MTRASNDSALVISTICCSATDRLYSGVGVDEVDADRGSTRGCRHPSVVDEATVRSSDGDVLGNAALGQQVEL